jgi:hypothetical protein
VTAQRLGDSAGGTRLKLRATPEGIAAGNGRGGASSWWTDG